MSDNISATHKRLQWLFCRPCNYTTKTSKAFTGLYSGFSVDLPHSSARNTAATQAAYIPPAQRWSTHTRPDALHRYPDTTATQGRCTGSAAAYYNNVYKGAAVRTCYRFMPSGAAYRRPCQRQRVSASGLHPVQRSAQRLEIWNRSATRAHRVNLAPSTRRGSPAAEAERAARNH